MNSSLMFPLLESDQIEVKVKQVSEKGAVALLYKTARTDMDMLDSVAGAMNWRVEYCEIKGNLYCTLYLRDGDTGEWVGKQDCGIESRSDGDGNEKKGEASDAFKRAGFRWGIGRELYTAPFTFLNVPTKKNPAGKFELANRFERFSVSSISYDENRHISALEIVDSKNNVVFTMRGSTSRTEPKENQDAPTVQAQADESERRTRNHKRLREYECLIVAYDATQEDCETAINALREQGAITSKKMADMSDSEFDVFMIQLEKRLKLVA